MAKRRRVMSLNAVRRSAAGFSLAVFTVSLLAIAASVNYFAHRPGLRATFDATRTRAYSLSEQTRRLLADLEGDWTIAVIMVDDEVAGPVRRQIDEVLQRYRQSSDSISIVRVDPTRPETLGAYETLLAGLRGIEAERIDACDRALDDGVAAFTELQLFAQQQTAQLELVLDHVPRQDPVRRDLQQRLGPLGLLAREGRQVLDAIAEARATHEMQPLPDYETARSILAEALSQWGDQLYEMSGIYATWRTGDNPVLARFAATAQDVYETTAQRLAGAADPLRTLPLLELSTIGRRLQSGEVALIMGPAGSAVIPSEQLFPKLNLRAVGQQGVAFDRRFRGEQVISAAIRSLLVEQMPMVVFTHADAASLLTEHADHADAAGMRSLLESARWTVAEWRVPHGPRPSPAPGQPVVWVVIPPRQRAGLEPDAGEQTLIRAAHRLVAEGADVLLSVNPSLLPRYRQADPWQAVSAPFNLRPDTARVILEAVQVGNGEQRYQTGQAITRFDSDHPVALAADGQQCFLVLPVAIEVLDAARDDVHHDVLASIEPDILRWQEADWLARIRAPGAVERGDPFPAPLPVVTAAERVGADGAQRFVLAGSGGWLFSNVADAVTPIGGGRRALMNPGNQELFMASVAWLAGMDDLIAPGPVSRQVARLDGIDRAVTTRWVLIAVLGTPLACLLLGAGVWGLRKI